MSSLYSFNLLFFTQVLTVLTTTIKYNEFVTDQGTNITIRCEVEGSIMWLKEEGNDTRLIQTSHVLVLTNITEYDSGIYVCLSSVDNEINSSTNNDNYNHNNYNINNDNINKIYNLYETNSTTIETNNINNINNNNDDEKYQQYLRTNVIVRTPPGPVSELYFKASTILGYLIWKFNRTNSGGYPIRSFTAEFRKVPNSYNDSDEWIRLDPINISPNVRQMEVFHLHPNTTYEFRIWANNVLGSGEMMTTNVTTLAETKEEDLVRLIMADVEKFDPRIWVVAVSIVLGTLVILGIGLCVLLAKECNESPPFVSGEDGWASIELVPNIILNPGFCDNDDTPYTRTIIFGEDDESDGYDDDDDLEEEQVSFKRRVSIFFTGHTIKRI